MANNVSQQGIEFEIVAETKKAVFEINKITMALKGLRDVNLKKLWMLTQEVSRLSQAVSTVASNNVSVLATGFESIGATSDKIKSVSASLEKIAKLDFANITKAAEAVGKIAEKAEKLGTAAGAGGKSQGGSPGATVSAPEHVPKPSPAAPEVPSEEPEPAAPETDTDAGNRKALLDSLKLLRTEFTKGAEAAKKFGAKLLLLPFKKIAASIRRVISPLQNLYKQFLKIAVTRALREVISGLGQALNEGIKNLYEYSRVMKTTFHSAMDSAATDVLWLKNSLGTAVGPVIEYLIPLFDALTERITEAFNRLGAFFALLSGKKTYSKAIKSATEFGESNVKAAKQVRMLISGVDELNAFAGKTKEESESPYASMFEEADVENEFGDFGKLLKDLFSNGDWKGLGDLFGSKLNEIVLKIDWKGWGLNLGEKIDAALKTAYAFLKSLDFGNLGSSLANFLNGIFERVDFENAGRLFVRKITALFDFIIGFIRTLNWDSAAKAIGDFFTGAFREASEWLHANDFGDIGRTLSDGVKKILDKLLEAVRQMDWYALGKAIGDFIGAIDWPGIFLRVAEIVWTAFKGAFNGLMDTKTGSVIVLVTSLLIAVKGLFIFYEPRLKAAVESFVLNGTGPLAKIVPAVSAVVKGLTLAVGAVAAVYDIAELIRIHREYNNALTAHNKETETALNSYAKLYNEKGKEAADAWAQMTYQIDTTNMEFDRAQAALSEKIDGYWADVPQNMWEGFKQGWSYYWDNGLINLVKDAFTSFIDAIKDFLGIHSPSTVFYDIGADLVNGLFNGISETWTAITEFFTQTFSEMTESFRTTWETVKTNTSETWDQIKQEVTARFTETKEKITQDANTLKQNLTGTWNATKAATVSAWTAMKTEASAKFTEIKNTIHTRMNEATNYLRSISWVSIGSNLVSGFLNGLKSAWSAVTSWVSSAASALTSKLKSAFKIGSPSKLWADIGTYLDLGLQEGLEGGTNRLVATASGIASAVNSAMIPSPTVPTYSVNAPAVSNGTEDYAEEESMSGILPLMEQMFAFMQTNAQSGQDIKVMIDGREVFNAVVNENRRAIQRTGESPIRV